MLTHNKLSTTGLLNLVASTSLIALIFLCVAWELWLAPFRTGGSMLVLKVLPLMAPLFGVLRGKRYTYQWASMLILAYFCEGVVRAWAEQGMTRWLASVELSLAVIFFVSAVAFARLTRLEQPRRK